MCNIDSRVAFNQVNAVYIIIIFIKYYYIYINTLIITLPNVKFAPLREYSNDEIV